MKSSTLDLPTEQDVRDLQRRRAMRRDLILDARCDLRALWHLVETSNPDSFKRLNGQQKFWSIDDILRRADDLDAIDSEGDGLYESAATVAKHLDLRGFIDFVNAQQPQQPSREER